MGYPLVPGYKSVGRVAAAGPAAGLAVGARVFVPGANCFGPVRGLFGGAASRLVVPSARAIPIDESWGERGVLLSLAATAYHCTGGRTEAQPELIVGHGVVGRLLARIAVACGAPPPVVWERAAARKEGAEGWRVCAADEDARRDYRIVCDASGDGAILDPLISRLAPGGEIILAGFYHVPLSFAFPPAFMREARLRIAAQFTPADLAAVTDLVRSGRLSLDGLVTHTRPAADAAQAYRVAFEDMSCLKMIVDWRGHA